MKKYYSLRRINECIDSLGDAKLYLTLNATSGFLQISNDTENTPSTSYLGLNQFLILPSNLENYLATFQRVMDVVLATVK